MEVGAATLLSQESTKYLVAVLDDFFRRFSKEASDTNGIAIA